MTTDEINENLIIPYLLDDLGEESRRQVEERFFRDDDYFELLCAVEEDMLVIYFDGGLSSRDRTRLEELYSVGAGKRKAEAVFRLLRFVRHSFPNKPAGEIMQADRISSAVNPSVPMWHLLAPGLAHGRREENVVEIPLEGAEVGLRLTLDEVEAFESYDALVEADRGVVWQALSLRAEPADDLKELRLAVPTELLTRYEYLLRVFGVRNNGEREELDAYGFRIRYSRPPAGTQV
jgi:hypothetical protein